MDEIYLYRSLKLHIEPICSNLKSLSHFSDYLVDSTSLSLFLSFSFFTCISLDDGTR